MVAKTVKFIFFMAMLLFGVMSIPRMMFLFFLLVTGSEMPGTAGEVLTGFVCFVIATVGFVGVSGWLRRREDIYS